RHIHRPQDVARHIAQRAAAEVEEAAPVERIVETAASAAAGTSGSRSRRVRPRLRDPQPQVPIECRWRSRFRRSLGDSLRPDRTIGPGVDFGYIADLAGPDDLRRDPRAVIRVALVAHLRGNLIL